MLIKEHRVDVLRIAQPSQVLFEAEVPASLVSLHRFAQKLRLHGLNRGELACRPGCDRQQDGNYQGQGQRQPEREKDSEEQGSHLAPFLFGRAKAKMYPAPRMVLMWSSSSPSFFRTLLTCISMLRSKGENFRPSTSSTSASRVTTRPASRRSTCSRLNSTEVSSTGFPRWKTVRVAGSSSTSPTLMTSGTRHRPWPGCGAGWLGSWQPVRED